MLPSWVLAHGVGVAPGHWFGAGDGNLHMVGTPDHNEDVGPKGYHYCLAVEDIDIAVAELEAKQIPYKEAGSLAVGQIWIRDPPALR